MVVKKIRPDENPQESLGPRYMDADNVIYYCRHAEGLSGNITKKAQRLVKHDCIKPIGKNLESKYCFVALPLNTEVEVEFNFEGNTYKATKEPYSKDYNSSEYIIKRQSSDHWSCNCQGYTSKDKKNEIEIGEANCAHVLALYFAFKIKRFYKEKKEKLEAQNDKEGTTE